MTAAFFLSLICVKAALPLLRRLKVGQPILEYVKEHEGKSGIPTMGGLCFVLPACILALVFARGERQILYFSVAIGVAYLGVGFLDDFLKIRYKHNEGLKPYQKLLFQFAIAAICGVFCLKNGLDFLQIPFTGKRVEIGWWIVPVVVLIFLSATNCVNLTDGLDGLAGSVSLIYFLVIGLIIALQADEALNRAEWDNLSVLSFTVCGGICGFLCFNFHPASVFMGDTGSMALGGLVASVSVFSGNSLYIPILGIMYVCSGISVILQVASYKKRRKRVFLMAPFHHHLQMKGYSEEKIAVWYAAITLLAGSFLLISLL